MRIAVITGASSGIGREFARQSPRLYKRLDELWIIARREERLKEVEQEITIPVRIFAADLTEESVYEKLNMALGSCHADIRMLVNSAGFGRIGTFSDINIESQLSMVELNCKALTRMSHLCLNYMSEGSRIINVASASAFGPQPGFTVYAASKAYVYSFSLALGEELKEQKIYVTAVCPGPVSTEFFDHTGKNAAVVKDQFRADADRVVRQALIDAKMKRSVSVYGAAMKAAKAATKLLPDPWIAQILRTANEIEDD